MSNDIKENILTVSAWVRILLILVYVVFAWVVGFVIIFLIIVQAICNLLFGENNPQVKEVSRAAVDYFSEILAFMTYCSNNKPAPFSSFNDEDEDEAKSTSPKNDQNELKTEVNAEEATANVSAGVENECDDDVFADISFTAQENIESLSEGSEAGEDKHQDKKP